MCGRHLLIFVGGDAAQQCLELFKRLGAQHEIPVGNNERRHAGDAQTPGLCGALLQVVPVLPGADRSVQFVGIDAGFRRGPPDDLPVADILKVGKVGAKQCFVKLIESAAAACMFSCFQRDAGVGQVGYRTEGDAERAGVQADLRIECIPVDVGQVLGQRGPAGRGFRMDLKRQPLCGERELLLQAIDKALADIAVGSYVV